MSDAGEVLQGSGVRRVIGLDLSLRSSGICVLQEVPTEPLASRWRVDWVGSSGYPLKKDSTVKESIERMVVVAGAIVEVVRAWKPVAVGIEGYAFGVGKEYGVHDISELHGVVNSQLWLACHMAPINVPPTQARLAVLGKGRPKGKKGIAKILKDMGLAFDNDDIADAYVIAKFVAMNLEKRQAELLLG